MRRVVTGVDDDGRSSVVSDSHAPVAFGPRADGQYGLARIDGGTVDPPRGGSVVNEVWSLGREPSVTDVDPTVGLDAFSADVAPGETKWIITQMGPDLDAPMHSTPTIDYGVVVAGDVELGLESGSVHLHAGDCVVVNGVQHSWRAGPDGCVIATVLVGITEAQR
jgi:mannose-6-phosphate isomerase-like protein (cupin superfamily)